MKKTKISVICQTSPMGALVVPMDMPLDEAINRFAGDPTLHGIFLVDAQGNFMGVVSNQDLLEWARLQFDLLSRDYMLPVGKVRRLLTAHTIGDLALPDSGKMAAHLDDSLESALLTMSEYGLEDIAVIDDAGRIINDLRLSEVLHYALQVGAAKP
jgi:CBS-domain-containing membrane protein